MGAQDAPRIAGRPLVISAQIEPTSTNGVIVSQGGSGNGYAFYLQEGKLAFAVRITRNLTTVTASKPLGSGRFKVEARLAADGRITLTVDGKQVAEGRAPGLIETQPARGFRVGSDATPPVGDYTSPNTFSGKIENVTLRFP